MSKKTLPNDYFEKLVRYASGESGEYPFITRLWDMKGPEGTKLAWLSCYAVRNGVVIVETFHDGTWTLLSRQSGLSENEMLADAFNRCQVPVPKDLA